MAKEPAEDEGGITPPRETSDFVGHDDAEGALLDAVAGGRLPHAWLISGPEGTGKATLAYRFARYLLANPPGDSAADGGLFAADDIPTDGVGSMHMDADDPIFRRVAASGHGDILTVERQVNDSGKLSQQIRIDDVRQAIDFAHMTSSEGGYKVIIVDGAELMNRASENAFLKILEEPPADTVILMVSHNPGRLLPTTRSRCRKLNLKPLPTEMVVSMLQHHMPETSAEDAAELARLSDGSIGRALRLASGGGLAIYRDTVNILGELPKPDIKKVQALATKLAKSGADDTYRCGIDLFRWWLSRIVLAASRGAEADRGLNATEKDIASRAAATAILPIWLKRMDDAESLIRSADSLNLDRKQVVQSLFLSLA